MSTRNVDLLGQWVHPSGPLPVHAASDATNSYAIFKAPFDCRILEVQVHYDIAITGADTNTHHVNVDSRTSAFATPTERGNKDFTLAVDASADTVENIVSTAFDLDEDACLSVEYEEIGDGGAVALGVLSFFVTYRAR